MEAATGYLAIDIRHGAQAAQTPYLCTRQRNPMTLGQFQRCL